MSFFFDRESHGFLKLTVILRLVGFPANVVWIKPCDLSVRIYRIYYLVSEPHSVILLYFLRISYNNANNEKDESFHFFLETKLFKRYNILKHFPTPMYSVTIVMRYQHIDYC